MSDLPKQKEAKEGEQSLAIAAMMINLSNRYLLCDSGLFHISHHHQLSGGTLGFRACLKMICLFVYTHKK